MARSREGRLMAAFALNVGIVGVQVVGGVAAHSLGLLADAGHNLTDVAAIALSMVAVRLARRQPTPARSFGWHRSTILAAQANAAGLLAVTALVVVEAVRRLGHPGAVEGLPVVLVALTALVANGAGAALLRGDRSDLNRRAVLLHLAADAAASGGVALAGLVFWLAGGLAWLDPAVSMAISVLIAVQAVGLLRESTDVLLESTPGGLDVDLLAAAIRAVEGVDTVHDLHVWSLSSDVRALSAHVVLLGHPTLEEAQATGDDVKAALVGPFAVAHATLELECETCEDRGDPCAMGAVVPSGDAHRH